MSNEIQVSFARGLTVYSTIRNSTSGFIWSVTSGYFENPISGNAADYGVSLTEEHVTGVYKGNFPPTIPAGVYNVLAKQQIGGSEAQTDPTIGAGDIQWNGSIVLPLSNIVASGVVQPIRIARGTMVQNFGLYLKSSADHVTPFTSGVVSGQISRDGGAFGVLQSGLVTEVGLGFYRVHLTSGDLLANTASLLFTATGVSGGVSDPLPMAFVLQRTSGQ